MAVDVVCTLLYIGIYKWKYRTIGLRSEYMAIVMVVRGFFGCREMVLFGMVLIGMLK